MRNVSKRTWNWISHSGWVSGNFYFDGFSLVGETHLGLRGFSAFQPQSDLSTGVHIWYAGVSFHTLDMCGFKLLTLKITQGSNGLQATHPNFFFCKR